MSKNNNITELDLNQMLKRTLDEANDAQRVVVVSQDIENNKEALTEAVREGVKDIKIDIPVQPEIKVIEVPVIVKEIEKIEIPVLQREVIHQVVEKPVIVKELEIKVIEVEKIVVKTDVQVIEKPVVIKEIEIKEVKVSDSKAVLGLLILNAILLIAMIITK